MENYERLHLSVRRIEGNYKTERREAKLFHTTSKLNEQTTNTELNWAAAAAVAGQMLRQWLAASTPVAKEAKNEQRCILSRALLIWAYALSGGTTGRRSVVSLSVLCAYAWNWHGEEQKRVSESVKFGWVLFKEEWNGNETLSLLTHQEAWVGGGAIALFVEVFWGLLSRTRIRVYECCERVGEVKYESAFVCAKVAISCADSKRVVKTNNK